MTFATTPVASPAAGLIQSGRKRPMMAGKLEAMEAPVAYYVYPDDGGRWRWVLSDRAGRPLAVSPESYEREEECRRMIAAVMRSTSAPVLRT